MDDQQLADANKRITELEAERDTWKWATEAKDKQLAELIEHSAAVEAERDRLLADNVALREALTEAQCYIVMYRDELPAFYGPWSESDAAEIAKDLGSAEAALSNQAATEALERLRREAVADWIEQQVPTFRLHAQNNLANGSPQYSVFIGLADLLEAKAAELRGGE